MRLIDFYGTLASVDWIIQLFLYWFCSYILLCYSAAFLNLLIHYFGALKIKNWISHQTNHINSMVKNYEKEKKISLFGRTVTVTLHL